MIVSDDLLIIIEEVCGFYNISINDTEFVNKLESYLINDIRDSDCLSYDDILEKLNEYAGSLLFDEYFSVDNNFIKMCLGNAKSRDLVCMCLDNAKSRDLVRIYLDDVRLRDTIVNILIFRYKKFILNNVRKYIKDNSSISINDLFSVCVIGILEAIHLDSSLNTNFVQNIGNKIEQNIRDRIESFCDQDMIDRSIDLESIPDSLTFPESVETNLSEINICDKLKSMLNKEEYLIIMLKFGFYNGEIYSYTQIAKELAKYRTDGKIVTREAVGSRTKRILKKLKDMYILDQYYEKTYELRYKLNRELTLWEYLNCSKDELYNYVDKLSRTERGLLRYLYGDNLDQPYMGDKISDIYKYKIYKKLINLVNENSSKSLIKK